MDGYVVDFTGIELDMHKMEERLPKDKHDHATSAVQDILLCSSASFKSLQSLLSFLSFCTRVIPLSRLFLYQLFNGLRSLMNGRLTTVRRLSPEAISDLHWWLTLLHN